jgi:hypothetical protein
MTKQLEKAFAHIRNSYPDVCMVVFSKNASWQYMTDDFDTPVFGEEIEQEILEDAAESIINSSNWLPCVFQIDENGIQL